MKNELKIWLMAQVMRYAQNGCCDEDFYYDGNTLGDYTDVHIHIDKKSIKQAARDCSLYILNKSKYETYDDFVKNEDEEVIESEWKVFIPHFEIWADSAIQIWKINSAIELEDWEYLSMIEDEDDDFDDDDDEEEEKDDHPEYESWFRETYCSQ